MAGSWRSLHNEELRNLYISPNIIKVIIIKENEVGGACISVGKPEWKRPAGRPCRRWDANIRANLMEIGIFRLDKSFGTLKASYWSIF